VQPGRAGLTFAPGKKLRDALTGHWHRDLDSDLQRLRFEFGADHFECRGFESRPPRYAETCFELLRCRQSFATIERTSASLSRRDQIPTVLSDLVVQPRPVANH